MAGLKIVLIALVACCVSAVRDPPKPCCAPDLFEVSYGESVGTEHRGRGGGYSVGVRSANDFANKKFGAAGYITMEDGKSHGFQTIILEDQNAMYTIVEKHCERTEIPAGSLPVQCVPGEAVFVDQSYMGNNSLTTNNWFLEIKGEGGVYGTLYETVEVGTCIPVGFSASGVSFSAEGKVGFMASGGYSNYTDGVEHGDFWFVPPDFCPTQNGKFGFDNTPLEGMEFMIRRLGGLLV